VVLLRYCVQYVMNRNEWLILTADVVERLCTLKTCDFIVRPNDVDDCNVYLENVATMSSEMLMYVTQNCRPVV